MHDSCTMVAISCYHVHVCTAGLFVFSHIGLYTCMWPKNDLFSALPFEKILLSMLYNLLVEFKCLLNCILHLASFADGAIHTCSIKVGRSLEYCIMVCHTSLTCII